MTRIATLKASGLSVEVSPLEVTYQVDFETPEYTRTFTLDAAINEAMSLRDIAECLELEIWERIRGGCLASVFGIYEVKFIISRPRTGDAVFISLFFFRNEQVERNFRFRVRSEDFIEFVNQVGLLVNFALDDGD